MKHDKENSIYQKMNDYWPIGHKEQEFKEYQKLCFIRNNI